MQRSKVVERATRTSTKNPERVEQARAAKRIQKPATKIGGQPLLEHVDGYEEVPRAWACLDSAGLQISGCAFKHGGALCMDVACAAPDRADGEYVMFIPMVK